MARMRAISVLTAMAVVACLIGRTAPTETRFDRALRAWMQISGSAVTSRNIAGDVTASRVVWGDLKGRSIAPTPMAWRNLERANRDLLRQ
jgi:hypothetical protein